MSLDVLRRLKGIALRGKAGVAVRAAEILLDRAWGKPRQEMGLDLNLQKSGVVILPRREVMMPQWVQRGRDSSGRGKEDLIRRGFASIRRARQVAYSLSELQQLSGIRKERLARVLASNGVEFRRTGVQNKRMVFISELERSLPELVDSVRFRGEDE